MSHILATKKDEAMLYVSCDDDVAQELSDYFSFFTPGYQYQPKFKAGIWDGKIRLFDRRFYTLPYGLIAYLQKFATDRGYQLSIDDNILLTTNFSITEAEAFAQRLQLPHTPYDHQIEAFAKAIRNRRALVLSPTSSGKSLLIYLISRFLEQTHKKGLIIVPTTSLVEQLYSDLKDYGWNVEKFVHRIYAGKAKFTNHYLTISTWQSMWMQTPEYMTQFDFMIGDEAHQFKATSLTQLMNRMTNASVRIGTTGTLDGWKVHKLALEGMFGNVFQATTTRKLMDAGIISDLKIKCLVLKYPQEFCKTALTITDPSGKKRKATYQEEYQAVIAYPPRTKFIRNLTLSIPGNTLILFQLVEKHGKVIYEDLKEHAGADRVFFVHGEIDTEERERIRKIVEQSTNAIIVASYGTFSTGINIRNLHNVIFAGPSKSRIRNLQSIGRGLRKAEGKTHATLFDIVDDLRIGKRENFLLQHFAARATTYNEEKLLFKQYLIDLG